MAVGAPVVCSNVGGIPEVVGSAGPLLDPDSPDWPAMAARYLDAATHDQASERSLAQAKRFSWDRVVDGLEEEYRRLLAAS
jgi:glycosyltransferase involved in cell wall biosynthesis